MSVVSIFQRKRRGNRLLNLSELVTVETLVGREAYRFAMTISPDNPTTWDAIRAAAGISIVEALCDALYLNAEHLAPSHIRILELSFMAHYFDALHQLELKSLTLIDSLREERTRP